MSNTSPINPDFERLLPRIIDDGDREAIAELDALLKDNPPLQDEYVRYMSVHFLLNVEINPLGTPLESLCDAPSPVNASQIARLMQSDAALQGNAEGGDASDSEPRFLCLPSRIPFMASAAAMLLALVTAVAAGAAFATYTIQGGFWREPGRRYSAEEIAAAEEWLTQKRIEQGNRFGLLSSGPGGPWADIRPLIEESNDRIEQGRIALRPLNGSEGGGFLLELPPGHGLEVMVYAESVKENSLVIKRVSATGVPTGHAHAFSTRDLPPHGDSPFGPWQVGRIGYWADFNEYDEPRYYLLCGVSSDTSGGAPGAWAYGSCQPLHVGPDLLCLGWDDGGMAEHPSPEEASSTFDNDHDDISAIIRIRRPEDLTLANLQRVATAPKRDENSEAIESWEEGLRLSIAPQESVVIQVGAQDDAYCKLCIGEEGDRTPWWTYNAGAGAAESKLYSINNRTIETLNLRVVASLDGAESCLPYQVCIEQKEYSEVGFDEEPDGLNSCDTKRVRVRCYWNR